jgi:Acyl-coenzyme A:6-aminopenicillanic acid acyl-transferase
MAVRTPQIDVVCEGDPRFMGEIQGRHLRESIAAAREALANLEAFRLLKPRCLPYPLFRRLAERRAGRVLQPLLARQAPAMAERLDGIAYGAGIGTGALALLNALEPLMSDVSGCTTVPPTAACSAVAVRGARSATGEPILAHNFDYLPMLQPFYVLRASRPRGGLRALEFTGSPFCGTADGMNECGVSIASNYAFVTDHQPLGVSISMLVSLALERCRTAVEAAEWIAGQPRWGGGLLMLADPSGEIISLELSTTRSRLRRPEAGDGFLFHSNHFIGPAMREVETSHEAIHTHRAPRVLRGRRVLASSDARYARALALAAACDRFDPEEVARLMSDHGPEEKPSSDTICMHGDYWFTTASLQFLPKSRRVCVAYSTTCTAKYREFEA